MTIEVHDFFPDLLLSLYIRKNETTKNTPSISGRERVFRKADRMF